MGVRFAFTYESSSFRDFNKLTGPEIVVVVVGFRVEVNSN